MGRPASTAWQAAEKLNRAVKPPPYAAAGTQHVSWLCPPGCAQVRELERHRAEEEKRRQQQTAMAAEKAVVEQDRSDKSQ